MANERIKLHMTMLEIFSALSEGNPGALTACLELYKAAPQIDPSNVLGGLGVLMNLDSLNLYGPKIWMLWKDVCRGDPAKVIAVLRGWQLGLLATATILAAIDNCGQGLDLAAVYKAVQERLPSFDVQPAPSEDSASELKVENGIDRNRTDAS
jgi:hypothetical protein